MDYTDGSRTERGDQGERYFGFAQHDIPHHTPLRLVRWGAPWTPAFAGVTEGARHDRAWLRGSRLRGNDGRKAGTTDGARHDRAWLRGVPASAGTTAASPVTRAPIAVAPWSRTLVGTGAPPPAESVGGAQRRHGASPQKWNEHEWAEMSHDFRMSHLCTALKAGRPTACAFRIIRAQEPDVWNAQQRDSPAADLASPCFGSAVFADCAQHDKHFTALTAPRRAARVPASAGTTGPGLPHTACVCVESTARPAQPVSHQATVLKKPCTPGAKRCPCTKS